MFKQPTRDQALALASIFQACHLVDRLANTGQAPVSDIKICMDALLNQNPNSLQDIYGSIENLESGIDAMTTLLGDRVVTDIFAGSTLTYVLTVLSIERQINSRPAMLESIAAGIDSANRQAQHFSSVHDNVIANLASLYQQSISTLRQRIQVKGNAIYLQQPNVAERIRCLLFSAVRSAFLWRQLGGKRYHLVVYRKVLIKALKD